MPSARARIRLFVFCLSMAPLAAPAADRPPGLPPDVPSVPYVPAQFDWLQGLAERFSNNVDIWSLQFSGLLGGWSRQPLLFAITPAKLLLLLIVLLLGIGLAALTRAVILRYHALGRVKPITERYWRNGLLFALRRALSGFFIFSGAFFASVPILPHVGLALGGFPTFAIAAKIAGLGYLLTVFGFFFRVARLVRHWLDGCAKRPNPRWYYGAFPIVGKALYYNLTLCALSTALYVLQLPSPLRTAGYEVLSIAAVLANLYLLIQAGYALEAMAVSRSDLLGFDIYRKRRVETRAQILRRLFTFTIVVVGIGAVLMSFPPVRQIGTGLLASAGVAGIVTGLAAQRSLGAVIGGIQIAITQPIRLDDEIIVEGEWGIVEEITLTYVVVRVWDQRRLIVPVTAFLEKSFQNWTRNSSDLIGTVFVYVDFSMPLTELREEARRVVESSALWDKRVFAFQVTELKSDSVEIRILASAGSAPRLFDLRCEIRDRLLLFLQERHPTAFPRMRAAFSRTGAPIGVGIGKRANADGEGG